MKGRRTFLKLLSGLAAGAAVNSRVLRAVADGADTVKSDDRFIIIHAGGGWDVTLWADPRNEERGLVDPASTATVTTDAIRLWTDGPTLSDGSKSFQMVERRGSQFGPAMGALADLLDRATIFNGIAMETVSHPDGSYYSATGRHLAGGKPVQTSIDTALASELGPGDLLPLMSVNFPSTYTGRNLDPRASPLRVSNVTAVSKSLARSELYTTSDDRAAVTQLLEEDARILGEQAWDSSRFDALRFQYESLGRILTDHSLLDTFDATKLQTVLRRNFFFDASGARIVRRFQDSAALNAAFAVEALKKGLVRCMSFVAGGFDTHFASYQDHPLNLQELFDVIGLLVAELDAEGLSSKTHILVISEFCRSPQINSGQGRDHYPNNSALVISPKFKPMVFGKSDPEQLLPGASKADGSQTTPSDLLATFFGAVGVDPRKFLRDGVILKEVLA